MLHPLGQLRDQSPMVVHSAAHPLQPLKQLRLGFTVRLRMLLKMRTAIAYKHDLL